MLSPSLFLGSALDNYMPRGVGDAFALIFSPVFLL